MLRTIAHVGDGGNNSKEVQTLFHPDGNSEENPIIFTEIIDASASLLSLNLNDTLVTTRLSNR